MAQINIQQFPVAFQPGQPGQPVPAPTVSDMWLPLISTGQSFELHPDCRMIVLDCGNFAEVHIGSRVHGLTPNKPLYIATPADGPRSVTVLPLKR